MRKKLTISGILIIVLALVGAGSWAYFTASGEAINIFQTGTISVDVKESMLTDDGDLVEYPGGPMNAMPGKSVSKLVQVENTGSGAAYIRVKLDVSVAVGEDALPSDSVSFDFDDINWIRGEDGYYYYNAALEAGARTAPLFKTVSFAREMGNEYQGCTVTVNVQAFAVQAANNPIPAGGDVSDITIW